MLALSPGQMWKQVPKLINKRYIIVYSILSNHILLFSVLFCQIQLFDIIYAVL